MLFHNIYTSVASEIFNPEEPSSKSFQLASLQKAIVKRVSLNELKISNTINVLSLKRQTLCLDIMFFMSGHVCMITRWEVCTRYDSNQSVVRAEFAML